MLYKKIKYSRINHYYPLLKNLKELQKEQNLIKAGCLCLSFNVSDVIYLYYETR